MRRAYALVFNGYADWELGHVLPELRRMCRVEVVTVGFNDQPVVSMGGLRVTPDAVLTKLPLEDVLVFIVPGGQLWHGPYPAEELGQVLRSLEAAEIPVVGICAATTVLARAGLLRGRKHTSNSLKYLTAHVPSYAESANYVDALAVRDRHVITASGLGHVELTLEVFHELNLIPPNVRAVWFDAFKRGVYPDDVAEKYQTQ